jgi:hypothetical protein
MTTDNKYVCNNVPLTGLLLWPATFLKTNFAEHLGNACCVQNNIPQLNFCFKIKIRKTFAFTVFDCYSSVQTVLLSVEWNFTVSCLEHREFRSVRISRLSVLVPEIKPFLIFLTV